MIRLLLAASALGGCGHAVTAGPAALAPCSGSVVTVDHGQPTGCDLTRPQRLDVRFPGADGYDHEWVTAECDDMGGTVVLVETTAVCSGTDY